MRPIRQPFEKKAEKTVYISMGTVNQDREFYRSCIEALGGTDYQVIISMGANRDRFEAAPDDIEIYESVDQMAVLSIADVFITHCGMNSASEGLYYGVPLILFPQTPEQDAVARRTEELGAGLRLSSISKDDILKAVERVLGEERFRQGAEKVSESFKNSGGVAEAVSFIESVGRR